MMKMIKWFHTLHDSYATQFRDARVPDTQTQRHGLLAMHHHPIIATRFAISLLLFSRPPSLFALTEPPLTNQRCTEAALTMAQAAAASLAATPSLAVVAVRCALAVRTHPHAFNSPSVPTCQAFGNSNFGGDAFGGGNMSQGGGFAVDNNGPDAKVRERIRWHRNSHR